jgi:hypothetical protein
MLCTILQLFVPVCSLLFSRNVEENPKPFIRGPAISELHEYWYVPICPCHANKESGCPIPSVSSTSGRTWIVVVADKADLGPKRHLIPELYVEKIPFAKPRRVIHAITLFIATVLTTILSTTACSRPGSPTASLIAGSVFNL